MLGTEESPFTSLPLVYLARLLDNPSQISVSYCYKTGNKMLPEKKTTAVAPGCSPLAHSLRFLATTGMLAAYILERTYHAKMSV